MIAYVNENNADSIYFFRSLDKGQTWTQNQIAAVESILFSSPLALDEKGNLHTAFDRLFMVDGGLVEYLYYSKSSDHGLTWQNSFISSKGRGSVKIAIDKREGSVYLVWNHSDYYIPNIRETYFCRSLTNGDSWDIPIQLNKTVYPTYTANFDTVVDSKGNFYILVGGLNIFLLQLPAGKDTWNPPIFIGKRDIIYTPLKITCDDQDTLYLIWNDNRSLYFSKRESATPTKEGPSDHLSAH